jgi:hypothetical protein
LRKEKRTKEQTMINKGSKSMWPQYPSGPSRSGPVSVRPQIT